MCIPFDWISILDFLGRLDVKAQNSIFPDNIGIKKKNNTRNFGKFTNT